MAELTAFGYFSGDSVLHRLDPRFKLLFIILLSVVCLNLYFISLGTITVLLLGLMLFSRLPLRSGIRELRYFFILLLLVFIARALSTGGSPIFGFYFVSVSREGLHDGLLICWRLALIVLLGFALMRVRDQLKC